MKNQHAIIAALGIALAASHGSPALAKEWRQVWSDEFNGASVDATKWTYEVNGNGGGNSELQYYTSRPQNSFTQNGKLVIRAIKETYSGPDGTRGYTSARLNSRYKGDWLYGRVEARLKVPGRQGLWPAFWMLPTDYAYGSWAASGEIDIMEHRGDLPTALYSTIHHGGPWPANTYTGSSYTGPDFTQDFHEYAIEWEPTEIRWYLDGNKIYSVDTWYSTAATFPAPFNRRFHILLNLAVGGNFLPNPPANANYFPKDFEIDWVRVYQEVTTPAAQAPFGGLAQSIPGTVIAANFDTGGQDVACHDTTTANIPGVARLTEPVDLETSTDSGVTHTVGSFDAGEWLEYTVDVQQAGNYLVSIRVASATEGGAATVKLTDASGTVRSIYGSFGPTGSASTWSTLMMGRLDLPAGTHTLRVVSEDPQFNLSTIEFSLPPQGPYLPSPMVVPGKVSMQDYDTGGPDVAYRDNTPENIGGSYRPTEAVDLGASNDTDGANSIGWFEVGEWVEYTINVQQTATYEIAARTASESQGGTLKLSLTDPANQVRTLTGSVAPTGGWTTWTTTTLGTLPLMAGTQILRVELTGGVANLNYLQFTAQPVNTQAEGWLLVGSD